MLDWRPLACDRWRSSLFMGTPMRSPVTAARRWVVLLLKLAAVAAAGWAQTAVESQGTLSLAGFALGGLVFLVAERAGAPDPEIEDPPAPTVVPRAFWWLFAAGCILCCAAGFLVHRQVSSDTTQPLWLLGLAVLIVAAACAWWSEPQQPRASPPVIGAGVLLVVGAAVLYGWHLTSMPPEVHGDEAEVGNDAIQLLQRHNLFTVGWYWLPMFHAAPSAVGLKLFGVNLLGLRAPSVAMGVATVLFLFAIAYRWWGFEVALLAGVLLAAARFFIHLSRTGYHYIGTPFVSVLAVWLCTRAWRDLSLAAAVWCGIVVGLGIQGYFASRLVPVLLTVTWLFWLARSRHTLWRARVDRFAVIAGAAVATAAPMIGFFWTRPGDLWMRTQMTSVFTPAAVEHLSRSYETHDLVRILLIQSQKAFTLFNLTGDTSLQYGYRDHGLFEPVSAALFVLGIAALCARPLQPRNFLLLLWTAVPVAAGAALTIDTPFFPRVSGMVPFAALVVALAVHSVLESGRAVLPRRAGQVLMAVALVTTLAVVVTNNIRSYFVEYAPHHRHGPAVEIAAWIRENGVGKVTFMVGGAPGFYIKHGTIKFLTYGYDTRDIVSLEDYLKDHRFDPAASRFIIMPPGRALVPALIAAVGALDVQEHRDIRGDVAFYTGIPRGAQPAAASRGPGRPL